MNQTKLGQIGIADIPKLSREDLFKTVLPMSDELINAVVGTDYLNPENIANKAATKIHDKGGEIFYSSDAISHYGHNTVTNAFKYFRYLLKQPNISKANKIGILAWITDNIIAIDKLSLD